MVDSESRVTVYILMILVAATGAVQVTLLKIQNGISVYDEQEEKEYDFYHPFVQAFAMTIGQFLWFIVYYIFEYYQILKYGLYENIPNVILAKEENLKTRINVLWFIIPSIFDLLENTLLFIALNIMPASVFQMLQGFSVIITAVFSIIFLKSKQFRHHWFSLILITLSLGLVGAIPLIYGNEDGSFQDSYFSIILAILLILLAEVFEGGHMISEEKLFDEYYIHPLKMAGWEGVFGVAIYSIILFSMQYIKCDDTSFCPYGSLEDTPKAISQMRDNKVILILMIAYILFLALYNAFGVALTKYSSATIRTSIMISHTAVIWLFFIFYRGPGHEQFQVIQLFGFMFLIFGILVYNEILILPCWGLNNFKTIEVLPNPILKDSTADQKDESESFFNSEFDLVDASKSCGNRSLRLSQYAVLSHSGNWNRTAINE